MAQLSSSSIKCRQKINLQLHFVVTYWASTITLRQDLVEFWRADDWRLSIKAVFSDEDIKWFPIWFPNVVYHPVTWCGELGFYHYPLTRFSWILEGRWLTSIHKRLSFRTKDIQWFTICSLMLFITQIPVKLRKISLCVISALNNVPGTEWIYY